MNGFTREQLKRMIDPANRKWYENAPLAAFALALLDRAETAEKRMTAWGCPDFDFICLNCGRETPCITEADLRPGDPGVPCTWDLTYPQMIERLRHYEDRQRKAEAERDEARAMKVPATTKAVTLAEMGEMVARTEAWAAKEELRAAEAERDRLQRALDLSEQSHREVREVCERHGVENALRLSVRLESVCDERDRLRAQLDSILANSDSLESGKLADANAEIARLREKLRAWQEKSDRHESERDSFRLEADGLREKLREAEAREPHYLRDSRLRAEGMRLAAEIARNLRPKEACTCGNYLSFRNGVPEHLPGCLVGECIDVADEIEGRAEEIDRSNNE